MKRIIEILIGVFFSLISTEAQINVSFFEEHIDFSLGNNYFTINGIYSFTSKTGKNEIQQIIFPFPNETNSIDLIRIIQLNTLRNVEFKKLKNSIYFKILIPANDTVDLNIFYRQKLSATNKYILTSTQWWGEPLKKVVYSLTTEKDVKIKSFTYQPNSIKIIREKKVYQWEKQNFMPNKDFEIIIED